MALKHEELKEMGILSVGHRLKLLKSVYDIKVRQDVPIDPDNYLPPCTLVARFSNIIVLMMAAAEASLNNETASMDDISRLIRSIKIRDERLFQLEGELRRTSDELQRINSELRPVYQMMKDRHKPLPYHPAGNDIDPHDNMSSPALSQTQQQPDKGGGSSLSRKFSTKRLFLNSSTSKANSPTHIPHSSIPENPLRSAAYENSNLDPSAAALAATSTLLANGGPPVSTSPNTINIPSPTSPNTYANQPTLHSRAYPSATSAQSTNYTTQVQTPNTARQFYPSSNDDPNPYLSGTTAADSDRERDRTATPNFTSRQQRDQHRGEPGTRIRTCGTAAANLEDPPPSATGSSSSSITTSNTAKDNTPGREAPSVEIFKSFRVSMEDPCWKVLPAALKKYQINADWRQYALYIVYGDQERCLGLEEKPLILFKQLDREGKKPMFMLRRHAAPVEGHSGPTSVSGGGVGGGMMGGGAMGMGMGGGGGLGGGGGGMAGGGGGTYDGGRPTGMPLPGGVL